MDKNQFNDCLSWLILIIFAAVIIMAILGALGKL